MYLFLSRIALICNVMFYLCVATTYVSVKLPQWLAGTMAVLGWFIVPFILDMILLIWLILSKRSRPAPKWLILFNTISLALIVIYFFLH